MQSTQVAVIGAGPGGYVAAFRAADLGLEVTLIDREPHLGGVCLHCGCIPTKTLLHVAHVLAQSREAAAWGVRFAPPQIDLAGLERWKGSVIARMSQGLARLAGARKVRRLQGTARFEGPHTLRVDGAASGPDRLHFASAVLATGSRPVWPPWVAPAGELAMDSTAALRLESLPASLLVVGGGYIGLELGSVYASLGTRVTVVELTGSLLPGVDPDLVRPLHARLESLFERILLRTEVAAVRRAGGEVVVEFQPAEGPRFSGTYERLLVAVGRQPNSQDLGLQTTAVRLDERGFVVVDKQRRTHEPSIFAVGDVIGSGLAHTAAHEAGVAVQAIAGRPSCFEPQAIPAVVFTDPEVAWCGLTETQAAAQGRGVAVSRFPWAACGRAATLGRTEGLTKLILASESERILGVGIVGPGAGELIAEGALAVEMAARAGDLALTIHAHPTLAETYMEAAEAFLGHSPHLFAPKRRQPAS